MANTRGTLIAALAALVTPSGHVEAAPRTSYQRVVSSVARMVHDGHARRLVARRKLNIVNVMWEDTGRYKGSAVGPNISDVTIEVEIEDARGRLRSRLMPVIRYPNFSDKTADVPLGRFYLRVGNEKQGRAPGDLRTVTLADFLKHPTRYMSLPRKGTIKGGSLWAPRDSHALASAQAAFLPIRSSGKATFWPVIFNYQSYARHPAVLTLLVTRQGTSMTIVDNSRDTVSGGRSWGQRLFFNKAGQRAPLTAERLSTVKKHGVTQNGESAASLGRDANLLMLVQIPLKVKTRPAFLGGLYGNQIGESYGVGGLGLIGTGRGGGGTGEGRISDVEAAVLGYGRVRGPYTELDGLTIERDSRFPVRVTVQFYQATSNGVVSARDVTRLATQIGKVYDKGDYVGSLVTLGPTGRPTEWAGAGFAPPWLSIADFPGLVERARRYGCRYGWCQSWRRLNSWIGWIL